MKKQTLLAAALVGALAPAVSSAEEAKSPYTFTGNVGLFSQYIFRGLTQTNREPAVQGGFDFSHESGFYLGNWNSNISWLTDSGAVCKLQHRDGFLRWLPQYLTFGDRISATTSAPCTTPIQAT